MGLSDRNVKEGALKNNAKNTRSKRCIAGNSSSGQKSGISGYKKVSVPTTQLHSGLKTTLYDELYDKIQSGPIKLEELAKFYRSPVWQMEKHVQVLEKKNLVELYYPIVGKPIVRIPIKEVKHTKVNKRNQLIVFAVVLIIIAVVVITLYLRLTK